jgi:hypothetical protein
MPHYNCTAVIDTTFLFLKKGLYIDTHTNTVDFTLKAFKVRWLTAPVL